MVELNWLFNVTINDISVIYVTAHRCAGGLKKKLDLRSGSQRHRHFVGFFNDHAGDTEVHILDLTPRALTGVEHLEGCDILIDQINEDDIYDIPPWEISTPTVNLGLHSSSKSETLDSEHIDNVFWK